jgi:hypothetical protein
MLALLKLLQRFVKTLHSEGTPAQIAAGMAMGAALGLTPLVNVHNLIILGLLIILNVSFAATKARNRLDWAPRVALEHGLSETIEYFELLLGGLERV